MPVNPIESISSVHTVDNITLHSAIVTHPPVIEGDTPPVTILSAAAAALQEATETPAQTAEEAREGDPVAIKKLHDEQKHAGASEPGKGEVIDQVA